MPKWRVAMMLVLLAGCANRDPFSQLANKPDPYAEKHAFDREKAIQTHLQGRPILPLEGIWDWNDHLYQVVIYHLDDSAEKKKYAGYDFIGRITDSRQDQDMRSDVKLLLRQSPDATTYNGLFLGPQGQRYSTAFVITRPGVMETSVPSGPYGRPQTVQIVRTYPLPH